MDAVGRAYLLMIISTIRAVGRALKLKGGCSACAYVHNMPALKLSDADTPSRQEKKPAKTELNWTAERNIPAYTQNFNTGATVVRPHRVLM